MYEPLLMYCVTLISLILQANSYDHHAAIYLLLLERIRTRSISQDSTVGIAAPNNQSVIRASDHDLKNTLSESQRRRSSSIAEQAMRKLNSGSNYGPYFNATEQQQQQQQAHQQQAQAQAAPPPHIEIRENGHVQIARGSEMDGEPRETISPLLGAGAYNRLSSNRMLSVGLDKRIMKQSSEDCRRLLQQVWHLMLAHSQNRIDHNVCPRIYIECLFLFDI